MTYTDERRASDFGTLISCLPRANWEDTSVSDCAQFTATLPGGTFVHVRVATDGVKYGWQAGLELPGIESSRMASKLEHTPGIALWRLLTTLAEGRPAARKAFADIDAVLDAAAVEYRKPEKDAAFDLTDPRLGGVFSDDNGCGAKCFMCGKSHYATRSRGATVAAIETLMPTAGWCSVKGRGWCCNVCKKVVTP